MEEDVLVACKLAKAGYGSPREILDSPCDLVIGMVEYEKFSNDYEEAFVEMNKQEST